VLADRPKLNQLSRAASARMETWTPRENAEGLANAVEKACNGRR